METETGREAKSGEIPELENGVGFYFACGGVPSFEIREDSLFLRWKWCWAGKVLPGQGAGRVLLPQ